MALPALAGDTPAPAVSAAKRPASAAPLTVGRLDSAGLRKLDAAAWDALSASALVENPFYARQYVLAGLETLDRSGDLRAITFTTVEGQLVGLFPYRHRSRIPAPLPTANAANNLYQFNGTPLVHRDHAGAVIDGWLAAMQDGKIRKLWSFNDLDTASPFADLLRAFAADRNLHVASANPYERAHLSRLPGGFEAHLGEVLSKNRLKDVRRTMRRLAEVGDIALEHVEAPAELRPRLEEFLRLEHAGWKGSAGTSFLSNPDHAAFARLAYDASDASQGFAALDSLLLDGKPIAMKLSIRTGRTAFTPKIAYDEEHKKLGPGMALEYMLIEDFYRSDRLDAVDAAATAEGHSALNFFNGMKPMATVIVGTSAWQVRLLARLNELRETLKHKVKKLLKRE